MPRNLPHARREAVMATIIPCQGRLGVSYSYKNGEAETGPIGPDDWPIISALARKGKISFTSQLVRDRFEAAIESAIMKGRCCVPQRTRDNKAA
jgi:hypothetical protein